jgi:hypothetical protein
VPALIFWANTKREIAKGEWRKAKMRNDELSFRNPFSQSVIRISQFDILVGAGPCVINVGTFERLNVGTFNVPALIFWQPQGVAPTIPKSEFPIVVTLWVMQSKRYLRNP